MTDAAPPVPWYQSRTVWVGVASALINIANSVGYKISPDFASSLPDILLNVASLAAIISTIWLHVRSKRSITVPPQPTNGAPP